MTTRFTHVKTYQAHGRGIEVKTQKQIEEMKKETRRLIDLWREKENSSEKDQVLNQLVGQYNILVEILK